MTDPHAEFVRESTDAIDDLNTGLVELELDDDPDVEELFRVAHTLKGNCGAAGFGAAADVAHALEDLLDGVRAGTVDPEPDLMDAAFGALDELSAMVQEVGQHGEPRTDPGPAAEDLRAALAEAGVTSTASGRRETTDRGARSADDAASEPASTATDDGPADLGAPEPTDEDVSVEEALERASVYDDLEGLAEEVDDADEFAGLEGGGSFDEVEFDDGDTETGETTAEPSPEAGTPDAGPDETGDEPTDTASTFDELSQEVDQSDPADLERELEEVEFGEFDEEDDMGIEELIEVDPDEATDAGSPGAGKTVRADESADEPTEVDAGTSPGPPSASTTGTETGAGPTAGTDAAGGTGEDGGSSVIDAIRSLGTEDADEGADAAPAGDQPTTGTAGDDGRPESSVADLIDSAAFEPVEEVEPADEAGVDAPEPAVEETGSEDARTAGGTAAVDEEQDRDGARSAGETPAVGDHEDGLAADTGADGIEFDDDGALFDEEFDDLGGELSTGDDLSDLAGGDGLPDEGGIDESTAAQLDEVGVGTEFGRDEETAAFAETFGGEFGEETVADDPEAAPTIAAALGERDERETAAGSEGSISLDVEDADRLLTLTERLITTQIQLDRAYDGENRAVEEGLAELRSVASEFEETVTDARLVPVESALRGLPRVVRDVARDAGKQVRLETEGEGVELDRSIVDRLGDPLVHVVRNAVDHGIERPEERAAAGKPEEGTVTVSARRARDRVVVEVTDDGRGIDADEVRDRAVEEGLLDPAEAAGLDDEAAHELLFRSGFSTTEEVTDVSGRGVGMDVVDRVATELGGEVVVESTPGEGTTVRFDLPVSVAVAETLFVEVGGERCAVPAEDVERVEEVDPARVREEDGHEEYVVVRRVPAEEGAAADGGDPAPAGLGTPAGPDLEGEAGVLEQSEPAVETERERRPLVRLNETLGAPGAPADPGVVVHVRDEVRSVALRCDGVGEWRKAVVTPYEDLFADVPGIDGATVLGDGEVVNVIDVENLE
jgi:two-component system chemotaxis sensor kinase CheA